MVCGRTRVNNLYNSSKHISIHSGMCVSKNDRDQRNDAYQQLHHYKRAKMSRIILQSDSFTEKQHLKNQYSYVLLSG